MISLMCGFQGPNKIASNTNQKQTHRYREQIDGCQWDDVGGIGEKVERH